MALPFYNWSRTASSNANADSTVNWAEGQAPSSVNDSGRAMMASTAAFRDDIAGAIVTGGASTAFTVTSYQIFDTLAHLDGKMIAFTPNATSTNAVGVDVTLNVDGLGAKPIRMQPSVALPSGTLILGTPYLAVYNNSDGVFYLHNTINPYAVPLGGMIDYTLATTPNSAFVFPIGQAISRTTYATLFSAMGTTYGTGDGSTTFNVPDLTGRVVAMKEGSATRLTSTYFGGNSTTLGAVGGGESWTMVTGNMPATTYNLTGTLATISVTSATADWFKVPTGIFGIAAVAGGATFFVAGNPSFSTGVTSSGSYTPAGTIGPLGSATPIRTVMPAIILNKILRII